MTHEGLRDRTIVVTGAAGGQGLAAALLLDEAGARVIATDVADAAPALAGTRVAYRRLDVADESHWQALATDLATDLDGARPARARQQRRASPTAPASARPSAPTGIA